MAMSPRLRRTGRQSPRSDTMPSGSTTRAAIATRTSTIAPGLQPVSSSPLANTPDRLKAAAETPANTSPVVRPAGRAGADDAGPARVGQRRCQVSRCPWVLTLGCTG